MTKQHIKKLVKKEFQEIEKEYKGLNWEKYGIDEDQIEVYDRGWRDAYRSILSMLEK